MLIQVEDVHYSYPGGVKALNGVSLAIHPGETAALVGQNGSGKTTLARHINGLLQPSTGRVSVGDWRTDGRTPAQMAHRVAYTFQNPDEQIFGQNVWEEVAFGPRNLGYGADQVRNLVEQALEAMGLREAAKVNPRDLGFSGRKRVGLASALAMGTPVLVLDEPTAGLDALEQELVSGAIAGLRSEGKTVVMITHDMDFAVENLERFILMHEGRVALDAPPPEFFAEKELLKSVGLTAPQIVRLSERLGQERVALNVEEFLGNEGICQSRHI